MKFSTQSFVAVAIAVTSCANVLAQTPAAPPAFTVDPAGAGVIYAADQDTYFEVLRDKDGNPANAWAPVVWGQKCVISDDEVGENGEAAIRIDNLDFLPLQFKSTVNLSEYRFLHIDIWPDSDMQLDFTLQNWWPGEKHVSAIYDLKGGQWTSIDIDMSTFPWGVKNGEQERVVNVFKLGGEKVNADEHPYAKTIYMTNIIAHNESPAGVEGVTIKPVEGNGITYNLFGIPVGDDYKGIVIRDGKKYIQ